MRLLILLIVLFTLPARAEYKCEVDLEYGLLVSEDRIRVTEESRTVYQINDSEQLFIDGVWIELQEPQLSQLREFADGIHYSVPKMIILATEGVELAIDTVEQVYTGLVGTDHKSYEKLQKALERVKWKVREKFIHTNNNYYIGAGSLERVDELVDRELEEQIEQAINTSLGGILSAISGLSSSNDAEMEKRIEELSLRLEEMGAEIERSQGPRVDSLREKARWFCMKMKKLNTIEEQLHKDIPKLSKYDVIIVD